MARPPSIRRPTLTVMAREVDRIQKKQARAHARLERALKDGEPAERLEELEAKAALTSAERETLVDAAKVAALLEKSKEKDEEAEGEVSAESREAALKRLEADTPATAPAPSGDEDP